MRWIYLAGAGSMAAVYLQLVEMAEQFYFGLVDLCFAEVEQWIYFGLAD